jgi:hypothetical protein
MNCRDNDWSMARALTQRDSEAEHSGRFTVLETRHCWIQVDDSRRLLNMAPTISALSPKEEENVKEVLGMRCRAACRPYLQGPPLPPTQFIFPLFPLSSPSHATRLPLLSLADNRLHRLRNRKNNLHGLGLSSKTQTHDGMYTSIVPSSPRRN